VARRNLLLAGLALLVAVICVGSYFVARAIQHELELARLQSDFVAAVSHEFRTPLASLNQVTEILADGRVTDADRLHRYYETQARATHRLQRLIESLLDFGRMEAGTKSHRLENVRAAEFVQSVVEEFRLEPAAEGYDIECAVKTGDRPAVIRADADALSHALRNLLDNAVKYSLECRTVWVELARNDDRISIAVRDRGLGIPPSEQKQIFRKFVRGAAAKEHRIRGTGVGLAMIKHIVQAHDGQIVLASEEGLGSTFTIFLPEAHVSNFDC